MRKLLCCAASAAALIFVASAADTAAPKKKTPSPAPTTAVKTGVAKPVTSAAKPPAPRTPSAKTPASKPATKTAVSHAPTAAARRPQTTAVVHRPVTTWRNRQASPSTDRYKEIQDALVSKGYLPADDASGKWDQNSVDALKRFQAEQKIDSTGRINSLSLIALGLGPKYESAPSPKSSEMPNGQR